MNKHLQTNKRLVALLILLLGVAGMTNAFAQTFTVGDLNYSINVDGATVTVTGHVSGQNAAGELVIPESVEYYDTSYPVTYIGDGAFSYCTGLTTIEIPNSVISIGNGAFYGCTGLTTIEIPNSVISIGNSAFYGCTGLTTLNYNAINAAINVSHPISFSSWLYGCSSLSNVTIGNTVQSIPSYFVYNVTGLTSVTIGNSVTSIGNYAFFNCSGLTTIEIPNSVTSIGAYAFEDCFGLTSVSIGNSVTYIGDEAFSYCTGLTTIEIPNSVTYIDMDAFSNCTGLTSVSIGNSVTYIGDGAFSYCTGLTTIEIPNSVTYIGWGAFMYCTGLTSMTVLADNPPTLNSSAFYNVYKGIPVYVPCGSLEAYQNASGWSEFTNYHGLLDCVVVTATANPEAGGTVTGAGTYAHGTEITLTAEANEGYTFVNWTLDNEVVGTEESLTIEVTGEAVYVANFEINSYEITAVANPEEGGIVTGTGIYNHFEEVTLTAEANEGYTFLNWTENGEVVSTNAEYSFYVYEDRDLVAHFELVQTSLVQTSNFFQGWNWWSTYIEQDGIDGLTMLEEGLGSNGTVIKTQCDGYVIYLPDYGSWIGNLQSINNESTYQVKTSAACTVEMTGSEAVPSEHPITLYPGWTWIGYPVNASMSFMDAMAGIEPQNGDILKSQNQGYASYLGGFGWYGSLNTLMPGMGLLYRSNNSQQITLTYPGGTRGTGQHRDITDNNYWVPNMHLYESNMIVTGVVELDGEEVQSDQYEVGAFVGDECRGSVRPLYVEVLDQYVVFLTITGNFGEAITFRLYDHVIEQEVAAACLSSIDFDSEAVVGLPFDDPYVFGFQTVHYTITATANPEGGGVVAGGGSYIEGETCTLTATPNGDYVFVNWTEDGEVVSTETSYSFTVTGNRDLVANFRYIRYEITVSANPEGGGVVAGGGSYLEGETCTVTATANEGVMFVNWTEDGVEVSTDAEYSFTVEGNRNLVAYFEIPTFTVGVSVNPSYGGVVTFDGGGGAAFDFEDGTLEGWTTIDANGDGRDWNLFSSNGNGHNGSSYLVRSASYEGGAITPDNYLVSPSVPLGGSITFYACAYSTNYAAEHFGVAVSTTSNTDANEFNTIQEWTMSAKRIEGLPSDRTPDSGNRAQGNWYEYTVDLSAYSGMGYIAIRHFGCYNQWYLYVDDITISGNFKVFNAGETCILTATPVSENYEFVNWTEDGEVVSTNAQYSFDVLSDRDLVANFVQVRFDITASANPEIGGTVTGAGTYDYGTTATLTATANEGYTFINWTKGGEVVSTNTTYSFTVTEAADYVANFELNTYEITATANPEAGGMVTGAGTYDHGTTATLTASANEGYTFINWTKGGEVVSTNTTYSFTVTEAADYVANFELNTYEITSTANPEAGGTVTGAGTYDHGTTATLTATANEGYTFLNWTKGGEVVSTNATYSFTVTEAADYVANFELNSYAVTATANPEAGGTVTGAGTYDHGTTATLTATANEGYTFLNWTKGGEVVSTNTTYSFTVTEAADYVANFELNSYAVTATANPEAGGTVTGAGTYDHGTMATLTATANEGYTFLNWTKGGEIVGTSATYSFTVTETASFEAVFELANITQTSDFVVGWTWWSSSIETEEADVLDQLKNGLGASGQVIKSQTASTMHLGNNWVGSLTLSNENGYMVKANGAVTVDITGPAATPESHPITLTPGWTWIGYPCTEPMTVAEALANHTPQANDVIKGQNASAMYIAGQWRGALTLTPGIGLMYKSNSTGNKTLTYATPTRMTETEPNLVETHWNANHNAYPTNMTVLAVVELDGEELNSEQYELAAFANGECRGSVAMMYVEPLDRYMALLTISGEEADNLHFGLYNSETGEECFATDETLTYETDAIIGSPDEPFVIRFRNTTGVDEWSNSLQVFPNPVERGQSVSLSLSAEEMGEIQVEIINALGMVETVCTPSQQRIIAPKVSGVYTLRITVEGKGTCYRKLVVR